MAVATMLGMSLTQQVALYMDPNTKVLIFPPWHTTLKSFLRIGGWFSAKYPQDGVRKMAERIKRWIATPLKGQDPSGKA